MTDINLMRLMVRGPAAPRRPRLSPGATEILNLLRVEVSVTSSYMADIMQISVPNAGIRLSKLCDKGYLVRVDTGAPSGGPEYTYHINPSLLEHS